MIFIQISITFYNNDKEIEVQVNPEQETVWLTRNQISELFDCDVKTIGKHINNALREELERDLVVAKFASTTKHGAMEGKTQTHSVIDNSFVNLLLIFKKKLSKI